MAAEDILITRESITVTNADGTTSQVAGAAKEVTVAQAISGVSIADGEGDTNLGNTAIVGNLTFEGGELVIDVSGSGHAVIITGLPTADPTNAGELFLTGTALHVSAG